MSRLNTNDLLRIFESLDENSDGFLSLNELKWLLERIGVQTSPEEIAALVGKDGLNFDDFSKFYETVFKKQEEEEEEDNDLYQAFKVFDLNGDGLISPQELQSVLWKLGMWGKNGALDCDRIISEYDVNSDGFVDFNEFKIMMLAH